MNNIFKKITSIILILVITSMSITVSGLSPDSIFSSDTVEQSTVSSSDNENLNQNPESTEPESESAAQSESDIDAITCDLTDIIKKYDVKKPTKYNIDIERSLIKEDNTYYIEMNLYAEITGDSCSIGDSSNEILIKNDDYSATLNTQNNTMFINNYEFAYLSASLKYENNQYYFPLQDVAEGMGYTVNENKSEFTLTKSYETKRILVKTKDTIQETQNAVAMAEISDNLYALQYKTAEDTENALEHFKSADNVQYCEPDCIVEITEETEDDDNGFTSWGAEPMGVEGYQNYLEQSIGSENLDDVVVAVIDTGIDTDHPWFENRIAENGNNFSTEAASIPYEDLNSHGTHVSGIICDLTFDNVKILPIKVLNAIGFGTSSQIVSGINYVVSLKQSGQNIWAMNMSLGITDPSIEESNALNEAVTNAYNNGILSIVAAGNDGNYAMNCSPANVECAITVAAIGKDELGLYTPSWSNFGNIVDISAPGVEIESAYAGGGTIKYSGTSMAAPHVVAAVALLCSNKNVSYTLPQIENTLKTFSIDLGSPGYDKYFGSGMVCLTNTFLSSLSNVAFSNTISNCTEPFQLTLSHPEPNVKIYYTSDGTTPSNLNGTLYTEPIRIESSVYVKAVAYVMDDNGEITKCSVVNSMIYCFDNTEPTSVFEVSASGMLTNYHGHKADVVIPSSVNGITITGIDDSAFYSIRNTVKTIILPDTVTLINDYAFYNCVNLTQVNAPSVTTIGDAAFKRCQSFEYLNDTYFPELLTIGERAFYQCYNLYSISLSKVTFIDAEAFCTDLEFVLDHLTEVSLPSVKIIGVDCFLRCKYLKKVYLPKVEMICNGAFVRCNLLTELDLPSLLYIGNYVFSGNLTTVNMPEVLSIGSSCFSNCKNLNSINMPKVEKIGMSAFSNCDALTNLYLLDLQNVGSNAFSLCDSLKSFYAPNLTEISVSVFSLCKKLNTVYIPSVINIKVNAFYNTISLNSITLSDSVQSITSSAFDKVNSQCVFYIYPNTVAIDFVTQNNFKYVDLSQNKNSFKYEIVNNKEVYITGHYSLTNNVEIPSYINGLPVTKICNRAFSNCAEITHLVSSNLIAIEPYAFSGCSNLKYICLSNIKTIGENSFNNCTNLESINIKSAENIDNYAFYGCDTLLSVEFCENISIIGDYAFGFDKNGLVISNFLINGLSNTKAEEYAVNNNIKFKPLYVNLSGFYYAYFLNKQTNQKVAGITSVDKSAVGRVIIPSSINGFTVQLISKAAFFECSFIDEVVLPETLTYIDGDAFNKCTGLRRINCEAVTYIGNFAFSNCFALESINLPNITTICTGTFYYCESMKSISLPNVTIINDQAFYECSSLKSLSLPNVIDISENTFYSCESLVNIDLPKITSIPTYAFAYCKSLKSIDLPNVTAIYDNAFYYCESLESISFPKIKFIKNYTFANCKSLKSISFPNVTTLYDNAFYYCESLVNIDLPKITSIPTYAFANCESLKSISFPNVTALNDFAFYYCESLVNIDLPKITSIPKYAFADCKSLKSISFPKVTSVGEFAFYYCTSLESVEFPRVTSIGKYVFDYCKGLKVVYAPHPTFVDDNASMLSSPNVTIYTFKSSAAYQYAVKNKLKYVLLDSLTPFQTNGIAIDSSKNYAYGLSPGITSLDKYYNLPSKSKISYNKTANGFGTGTTVNISVFDITYTPYKIVIFGDISGDGAIDAFDLAMLTSAVNFETEIPKHTAYEVASDTNRDGVIDIFDSGILTSDVNFESSIDQTTAPILL